MLSLMSKEGDKMVVLTPFVTYISLKWNGAIKLNVTVADLRKWKSDWNYEWTFSEQQKENILEIWLNVICVKKPQWGGGLGEVRALILC